METDEKFHPRLLVPHLKARGYTLFTRAQTFLTSFVGYHYIYIVSMSLILSWILYPCKTMDYTDSLYLAVSTVTNTGMGPIAGNDLELYQQIFLLLFSMLCHQLTINTFIVGFRIWLYERRFDDINERSRLQSKARRVATRTTRNSRVRRRSGTANDRYAEDLVRSLNMMQLRAREPLALRPRAQTLDNDLDEGEGPAFIVKSPMEVEQESGSTTAYNRKDSYDEGEGPALVIKSPMDVEKEADLAIEDDNENIDPNERIKFSELPRPQRQHTQTSQAAAHGATHTTHLPYRRNSLNKTRSMKGNYLSYAPTITGSTFVGLSQEQKDELGGVEYRALRLLVVVLVGYYFGFLFLAWVTITPWFAVRAYVKDTVEQQGLNASWAGIFLSSSAFLNYGYTINPDGMTLFQQSAYMPIWSGFFILAGNVAQPVLLRFILWVMFNLVPAGGAVRESIGFLLDHPRRCFLLLFPSKPTWILLAIIILLNVTDLVIFLAIEYHGEVVKALPGGYRFLCGLYQAVCLRTVGFNIMNISLIRPSVQMAYIVMMYVSIFPVAISVRNTNVYEEQTLGLWMDDDAQSVKTGQASIINRPGPVYTHLQRQLSHDMWCLALGIFLICICEDGEIQHNKMTFLSILFEAVSAYSCVGVSPGYPGVAYSLSGEFNVVSKLVMIALMIRGRHRGLPYKLDRAIMLKSHHVDQHDEIQQQWGRDLQSLMPSEMNDNGNWLDRVNTNVSRLRRSATRRSAVSRRSVVSNKSDGAAVGQSPRQWKPRAKSFNA